MPTILVNKQQFDLFLSECALLQNAINQTNSEVLACEQGFVDAGYKKPNLKKLVSDIKKQNKPVEQIFFKNTGGNISISPTQVDASVDTSVRALLSSLVSKDITAAAIEPVKRKQLADKIKLESKTFGLPAAVMQKSLNVSSSDFMQSLEVLAVINKNTIQLLDPQALTENSNVPTDEDLDDSVQEVFEEVVGSQT